jgi:hypothetical protein
MSFSRQRGPDGRGLERGARQEPKRNPVAMNSEKTIGHPEAPEQATRVVPRNTSALPGERPLFPRSCRVVAYFPTVRL